MADVIGRIEDFEEGQARRVRVAGRDVLVVRRDEAFFVLRDICPHQGAALSAGEVTGKPGYCLPGHAAAYERDGEFVTCPWHGWQFDLKTGESTFDPGRVRVRRYEVVVSNGEVLVDI